MWPFFLNNVCRFQTCNASFFARSLDDEEYQNFVLTNCWQPFGRVWVQDGKVIPNANTNMPGTSSSSPLAPLSSWFSPLTLYIGISGIDIVDCEHHKLLIIIITTYIHPVIPKHIWWTLQMNCCGIKHILTNYYKIIQELTRSTRSQTTFADRPRWRKIQKMFHI